MDILGIIIGLLVIGIFWARYYAPTRKEMPEASVMDVFGEACSRLLTSIKNMFT